MIRLPRRITTQLMLLLIASTVIFQGAVLYIQAHQPVAPLQLPFQAQPLVIIVDALTHLPEAERAPFVARINAVVPSAHFTMVPPDAPRPSGQPSEKLALQLRAYLPQGTKLAESEAGVLQIRIPDGPVVEVTATNFMPLTPNAGVVAATFFVMVFCGVGFLGYAYVNLRRPLSVLAEAADRFGREQSFEPVSERGPAEIAGVARMLNRMQERIAKLIGDRTRTLAALGHDLRTPITRMRLHAEKVDDPRLRAAMVSDLDYMQRMTHAALTFLRGDTFARRAPIDVASLLQSICDDAQDMMQPVSYSGPDHLIIEASIDELRRAVTNLVVNAVFQRANVVVVLRDADDRSIAIEVTDDGPGMPDADKARAFEPFWRGEGTRSDRTGLGIGLSIVFNVARSHDGEVSLHDRPGGGLVCRLRLPRDFRDDGPAPVRRPVGALTP